MTKAFRVIVVDDDPEIRTLLQRYLVENGFRVRTAEGGQALDQSLAREPADVVILDLMMPGETGLAVCQRLRARGDMTPVIMLTARGDPIDRVLGLELGADDYLAKPFEPRELLARIAAVLRRTAGGPAQAVADQVLSFGPFQLNASTMTLTRDGKPIELSSREFALLHAMAARPGRPLSRAQLIELAIGRDAEVTDRAIDVQVARLRKLIEDDTATPRWIKTQWGVGYVFAGGDAS